jgi:hypothetical protein
MNTEKDMKNLTNILRAINAVVLLACVVPSVSLSVYWKHEALKARKETAEVIEADRVKWLDHLAYDLAYQKAVGKILEKGTKQ